MIQRKIINFHLVMTDIKIIQTKKI